MIHIMADLETWGTEPGCDILSIGACVFDPVTGSISETFYVATTGGESYGLTHDPRTIQWWSEQSDAATGAFDDPVDLLDGLARFSDWIGDMTGGDDRALRLWSHGPAFDPPILAAAYRAVGLPVPWHYRAPRDTRTLFDVAGIDDHSPWLREHPGPLGIPHHALDDAICQARAVCAAYTKVRGNG